ISTTARPLRRSAHAVQAALPPALSLLALPVALPISRLRNAHPLGVLQHLHIRRVHQQECHHHRENVDEGYQIQMCIDALASLVRHQPEIHRFHGASPSAMFVNSATVTVCGAPTPGAMARAPGTAAAATSASAAGSSALPIASIAWISSS